MAHMQTSQGPEYVAPTHLTAAAGGRGGSWYVLLEGLASLVREICPALTITVVEGGGVLNHALVGSGQLPMAILNPPMTIAALAGRSPFDRAFPDLRVGVANLTTNYLQCMVDSACPVHTLHEWLQGQTPLRVPVDRVGTVDRLVFELTLQHFGVSVADAEHWGSRLVLAANYHEQLALYEAGTVDVLWQFKCLTKSFLVKCCPVLRTIVCKVCDTSPSTSGAVSVRYVHTLTESPRHTLEHIMQHDPSPRARTRAHSILLSSRHVTIKESVKIYQVDRDTVCAITGGE
jgi:hypothetical protein